MNMPKFRFGLKYWARPVHKTILYSFGVEILFIVGTLTLFGIADPDTYNNKLWLDGFLNGFNSSPSQPIYDLVNGGSYDVPLVWSNRLTSANLAIVILATFIWIAKLVMHIMASFYPIISFIVHGAQFGMWTWSAWAQSSPDIIDPDHPNYSLPWYITKNCNVAKRSSNIKYCQQAKAAFILTCFICAIYGSHVIAAIAQMMFQPNPKRLSMEKNFSELKGKDLEMESYPERNLNLPPTTPRTKAFQSLNGSFA